MVEAETDLYVAQHQGLVVVHRSLTEGLRLLATDPSAVAQAKDLGGFLLGHHHLESSVLFPGLRRYGVLRSTDVAFLDAREAEHRALHGLCERLATTADSKEISTIASEILTLFVPHIEEEERGLSPNNLREMITEKGLLEISQEQVEALRRAFPPPA